MESESFKFLVTVVVLAIPAFFYSWLIRSVDRFEKEPTLWVVFAFLWGALPAVIAAIVFQLILGIPIAIFAGRDTLAAEFLGAAVSAPVTEEILKGMAVAIIYLTRRREFDGWVDGIVYGGVAGFGFAYVENILYLMNLTDTWAEWLQLLILRTVVFGGLHGGWSALVGIGFGLARYRTNPFLKILCISGGLLAAIFGHLVHNGALTLAEASGGATILLVFINYGALILFLGLLWFVAGFVERRNLQIYLQDEVPGVISAQWYDGLCHGRWSGINPALRRQITQAAAELAQKKMQLAKLGEEDGNTTEINQLRSHLRGLAP
jgi:RsiW-degrading membrane proteinase PrsW (M82 family)